jgi:hypothetical protein
MQMHWRRINVAGKRFGQLNTIAVKALPEFDPDGYNPLPFTLIRVANLNKINAWMAATEASLSNNGSRRIDVARCLLLGQSCLLCLLKGRLLLSELLTSATSIGIWTSLFYAVGHE